MDKGTIALISIVVILFVGIVVAFPHTDMAKEAYAINRNNAINYIMAGASNPELANDANYRKECKRLVNKYNLHDVAEISANVTGFFERWADENS